MLKHHEVALANLIDRVARYGAATVSWDDLCAWFNTDSITKDVWRTIHRLYKETWEHYGWEGLPDLQVLSLDNHFTLMRDGSEDEEVWTYNEEGELDQEESAEEADE